MQVRRRDDLGIDTQRAQHRDVSTQSLDIGRADDDCEASSHEAATAPFDVASDRLFPMSEVAEALPREFGFRSKRVVHPEQGARPRGHPGADLVAFFKHGHSRAQSSEMQSYAASHDSGADHDNLRLIHRLLAT